MNEHEQIREMIALAAAGVLDAEEQKRVDVHVSGCEACRGELECWAAYAQAFRSLRPPALPERLVERTRARIVAERAAAADRRSEGLLLGALAAFAWIVGVTVWFLFRLFTGGAAAVLEISINQVLIWGAGSTILVWLTAAVATLMLGSRRRELERAS
jgi:anti-sigma factor RsiW